MKYILVSIEDDKWNATTVIHVETLLKKSVKPAHVQEVVFHGKELKEWQGKNPEAGK